MHDVFSVMEKKAVGNRVRLSYKQLSVLSANTVKKVRGEVRRLAEAGLVSIEKASEPGGAYHYEYVIRPQSADATSVIKMLYCEMAGERAGKEFDPLFQFNGFTHVFAKVGAMCKSMGMNEAIYVLSIFHCFPDNWCRKTFKQPYPPPYIFLNTKHAKDRYAAFERFIFQHADPEKSEPTPEDVRLVDELRVWELCGRPESKTTLRLMAQNGTLSQKTVDHILKGL